MYVEIVIGYVIELLGSFRELGIDFNTTQTVFLGGGSILIAGIYSNYVETIWRRIRHY
ncbi:MAG: hypothetical protein ACLU9T_17435 [Blautia faecis]